MRPKLLIPLLAVAAAAGVWVWWLQGGFGGPVSDRAARQYFERIVAAAMAEDFDTLCRLNSSVSTCEFELRGVCPEDFGSGPAPAFPQGEELVQECRESVPKEPPTIVATRHQPAVNGYVGGRILVVKGVDGREKPYETEVLIFRDKRSYKAVRAVFWSGDKFDELRQSDGVEIKGEPAS